MTLLLLAQAPDAAAADANSPVTVELPDDLLGDRDIPLGRNIDELGLDYVGEEFLVSGAATVYTYNNPAVPGEIIPLDEDVPYKTRIVVRRPSDPNDFNGTVVIEWMNSTAGFDTPPVWHASAEYFAREGIVWVGVTNSTTSIDFLVDGCLFLGFIAPPLCGTRYASLSMSGQNGVAFEMVSQIAHMLKSSSLENPLFPDYPVARIYHAGQSQQGGSMVTYATAFHFATNDGYFVQAAGSARRINFGTPCEDPNAPAYPDCTPTLQGADRRVATDLPVPVFRVQTETDMGGVLAFGTRQADSGDFRYYETAGTAHASIHKGSALIAEGVLGLTDPLFLEEVCEFGLNTLSDGPIFGSYLYNAMWDNMEQQVQLGTVPPAGDPFLLDVDPNNRVDRDVHGNALGGIRLPQMDVPVASYGPRNALAPALVGSLLEPIGGLFCILAGTVAPFDQITLDTLYPDWTVYVADFNQRIDDLVAARFVLPADADKLRLFVEDKDQRKCTVELSKGSSKLFKTLGKDIGKCIKDGSKRKLGVQSIEDCTLADNKGKVAKAEAKLRSGAVKKCPPLSDFGASDPNQGVAAGFSQAPGLAHSLFGPDLDAVIVDQKDPNDPDPAASKAGAKCQIDVAKSVTKCADTRLKTFLKCKQSGLKEASIHNATTLESCMSADPKGKVASTCETKLGGKIQIRCAPLDYAALFPGDCSGAPNLTVFKSCMAARAACQVCLALDTTGGLTQNCDSVDDGRFNASCP